MYQTAVAYRQNDVLDSFITERFIPSEALHLRLSALGSVSSRSKRLSQYFSSDLVDSYWLHTSSFRRPFLRRLGARLLPTDQREFLDAAAAYCVENDIGCHTHCTGAVEIFEKLSREGLPCILEQYVGDPRTGDAFVADAYYVLGLTPPPNSETIFERNEREYELSDLILAGSELVRTSLINRNVDASKIVVIPYGSPSGFDRPRLAHPEGAVLKVAFVGSDPVRKGLGLLVRAAREWGRGVEVRVAGMVPREVRRALNAPSNVLFLGQLTRDGVRELLWSSDIGCLPTFWEGSSLAVYEMCSAGLPVVTTPNAGYPGPAGVMLTPAGDLGSLVAAVETLRDPDRRRELTVVALREMQEFSWAKYKERTFDVVSPFLRDRRSE